MKSKVVEHSNLFQLISLAAMMRDRKTPRSDYPGKLIYNYNFALGQKKGKFGGLLSKSN